MVKASRYTTLAATALLLAAACTQQEPGSTYRDDPDAVRISAQVGNGEGSPATRSNPVGVLGKEESFKTGDRVCVTADGQPAVVYAYDGSSWTPQEDKFLKWNTPTMNFTAWYPAAEGVNADNFTVPADQSNEAKIAAADYMTCSQQITRDGDNPVSLSFQRRMARIMVHPIFNNQFNSVDYTVSEITVCGNTKGYSGGTVASGTVEVAAYRHTDGHFYALLSPTSASSATFIKVKVVKNGGTEEYPLEAKGIIATEAGKSYIVNLSVGKEVASVSEVTVSPWTSGEPISGGEADEIPYVTFSAASEQKFSMNFNYFTLGDGEYFEYSVGNGSWIQFTKTVTDIPFGGTLGNLRLRGKSSKGTASDTYAYSMISFSNVDAVKCTGDIRTLIDYTAYSTDNIGTAKFCYLFKGCTQLTSAPELPATSLSEYCYSSMFSGCTALTTAPELPATTLAQNCYYAMFYKCTKLETTPELKATDLVSCCYQYMFSGCTALKTAPELKATKLKMSCYDNMFSDCTALSSVKMLATTNFDDAIGCLNNWLKDAGTDASSRTLTVASDNVYTTMVSKGYVPELWKKAEIKASDGSTIGAEAEGNIPYVTFSAASEQAFTMNFNDFYLEEGEYFEYSVGGSKWVRFTNTVTNIAFGGENNDIRLRGKSSKGTASNNTTYCSKISFSENTDEPVNCTGDIRTLIDYTAYSTANTGTAKFCFLFNGCKQLTSAPELPATTLATFCYEHMFSGCTALTSAPELPATILANYCYQYMFNGCTSLEIAPALKATSLVTYCYKSMLYDCTKLSSVTMLATDVSGNKCLDNWLTDAGTGVTSRTLTLASETVYTAITDNNWLPDNWKKDVEGGATVKFQDSSSTE